MPEQKIEARERYKNELESGLSRTWLIDVLTLVWAASSLRDEELAGRPDRFLEFPQEAVGADFNNSFFIQPWVLETLVNEALFYPSAPSILSHVVDMTNWANFSNLYNSLNNLEDSESQLDIPEGEILAALPRITWRQFSWQIGYKSSQRFFRALWLYSFPEANDYFTEHYGISVDRFCFVGFTVATIARLEPKFERNISFLQEFNISEDELRAFFALTSISSKKARDWARTHRSYDGPAAYKPSLLREKPIIRISRGNPDQFNAYCPFHELIFLRINDGLFQDFVQDDNMKRMIAERFESYVALVTTHYFGYELQVLEEGTYGTRKSQRKTPDLRIVAHDNCLKAIVECKARRIPFRVLSSPNPFVENRETFEDLVKGVVQIWRYASDVRQGIVDTDLSINRNTIGVVLSLEPWLQVSVDTIDAIRNAAKEACLKHSNIEEIDQIPVSFVDVEDWERSMRKTDPTGVFKALKELSRRDRAGYALDTTIDSHTDAETCPVEAFDYRGRISDLASWWGDLMNGDIPKSNPEA